MGWCLTWSSGVRGDNLPVAVRQTFQPSTPQCAAQVHDHIDTGRWSPTMDREAAVIARNGDGPIDGEVDEEFDRHPSSATVKPSGWVGDAQADHRRSQRDQDRANLPLTATHRTRETIEQHLTVEPVDRQVGEHLRLFETGRARCNHHLLG